MFGKIYFTVGVLAFSVFCTGHPVFADVLYLKGGGRIVGKINLTDAGYVVKLEKSTLTYPPDRVEKYVKCPLPEEEYATRLGAIDKNSAENHYVLGMWCKANRLDNEAEKHLKRATELKPGFDEAWEEAGYKKYRGRWYRQDDYMKLQGYEKYGSKWLKKDEVEQLRKEASAKARRRYIISRTDEIFKLLRKNPKQLMLAESAAVLANMAEGTEPDREPEVVTALRRQAIDSNSNCRLLAITALGNISHQTATKILCQRSKQEGHPKVLSAIASGLASSKYREEILFTLLDKLDKSEFHRHIKRLAFCLQTLNEPEVVPELISRLDSTVVDSNRKNEKGKEKKIEEFLKKQNEEILGQDKRLDGKVSIGGHSKMPGSFSTEPVYPNYEALKILTGKDFGQDKEKWAAWWETAKGGFYFDPLQSPDDGKRSKTDETLERRPPPPKRPF